MRKPAALRDHLARHIPDLARDAERLLVFVDAGSLASTYAPGRSFEYRYTLNLIVTDFAEDPDLIMAALLIWLRDEQPELLANPQQRDAITFEVDTLANDKVDLSIKVTLTERAIVSQNEDGTLVVTNPSEPTVAVEWTPT